MRSPETDGLTPIEAPPRRQLSKANSRYMHVNDIDAMTDEYVQADNSGGKTWTRILVDRHLQNYKWYFPNKDMPNGPSLAKAWAFYEHFTLARHFTQSAADHKMERAEPGESAATQLYRPLRTPEASLGEFGIGVALYFTTLRVVAIILFLAGLMNISNMMYFGGPNYSNGQPVGGEPGELSAWSLKGTAICTEGEFVVCSDCKWQAWDNIEENDRFGNFTTSTGETLFLVLRNACERPTLGIGMVNFGTLVFLLIAFMLFGIFQRKRETLFDETKQTATDYTVVVKNPPPEEYDPEKWKAFFSTFSEKQVTSVLVALDNHVLLHKLLLRRVLRDKLRLILPKETDIDDEDLVREHVSRLLKEQEGEKRSCFSILCGCTVMPFLRLIYNIGHSPDALVDKIFVLTDEIKELVKDKYNVTQVYVTFETEAGQRCALEALTTSKLNVKLNRVDQVPPTSLFEGRVLDVEEPAEPSTVRWLELHVRTRRKVIQRSITFVLTAAIIAGCGYLVYLTRLELGAAYSGPLTTVFNSIIPILVKLLLLIESHANEGSRQKSLYLKVTIFRWVNTAILTKFITPFTSTVSGGNRDVLVTIHSILLSEMWLAPALRVLDIVGFLQKHYFGPRARTQNAMNLWYQGTIYNLGERYTDMTKVIFVCFFYSALFPSAFFFCSAILVIQYYTDKYCLMRIWAQAPSVGSQLAQYSRRYFFTAALLAYGITASYDWAQFPYDNICDDPSENVATNFTGMYRNVTLLNGDIVDIEVQQDESAISCPQSNRGFPASSTVLQAGVPKWMTASQETLADVYGWSSVALAIAVFVLFFGGAIYAIVTGLFSKKYKPDGKDAQIDFQNVAEISVYVPQFNIGNFQFPVLAVDIDDLNAEWIGWNDPQDPTYDRHNLIFDVPYEGMKRPATYQATRRGSQREKFPIFSQVKSWSRKQEAVLEAEAAEVAMAEESFEEEHQQEEPVVAAVASQDSIDEPAPVEARFSADSYESRDMSYQT